MNQDPEKNNTPIESTSFEALMGGQDALEAADHAAAQQFPAEPKANATESTAFDALAEEPYLRPEEQRKPEIRAEALGVSGYQPRAEWKTSLYAALLGLVVVGILGKTKFVLIGLLPAAFALWTAIEGLRSDGSPEDRVKCFIGMGIGILVAAWAIIKVL